MKYYFIILCCALQIGSLCAQPIRDSIEIRKSSIGTLAYFQNGERLRLYHIREMIKDNLVAYKEVKKAELNSEVHIVLAFAGTFMLGWALGTVFAGKDTDVKLPAIGAGLVAFSIPFALSRDRHARKAVKKYNYDLLRL